MARQICAHCFAKGHTPNYCCSSRREGFPPGFDPNYICQVQAVRCRETAAAAGAGAGGVVGRSSSSSGPSSSAAVAAAAAAARVLAVQGSSTNGTRDDQVCATNVNGGLEKQFTVCRPSGNVTFTRESNVTFTREKKVAAYCMARQICAHCFTKGHTPNYCCSSKREGLPPGFDPNYICQVQAVSCRETAAAAGGSAGGGVGTSSSSSGTSGGAGDALYRPSSPAAAARVLAVRGSSRVANQQQPRPQ